MRRSAVRVADDLAPSVTLSRSDQQQALGQIASALDLTLSVQQIEALLDYLTLLQQWNATYNLTAVREPDEMLGQHLADCLAVVGPFRRSVAGLGAVRVLDVGSGAGLPGVVLAVTNSTVEVTCVDAVGKKAAFIRQVASRLRLPNLHVVQARVENLAAGPFSVVVSRAFASLGDFVQLTRHHLSETGVWMAMKGKVPEEELVALPSSIDVFHVEPITVPGLNAERCLIWLRPRRTALVSASSIQPGSFL